MQPVLSTHLFIKQTLLPSQLDTLAAAGAQAVEIFASQPHFDYSSRPALREIAQYFSGSALKLHSLHAPMYRDETAASHRERNNVVHRERSQRIDAMDDIKRAVELAEQVPFRFLILHLDEYNEPWSEAILDLALTAVEHLQAFARPLGVHIALENLCNDVTQPENLLEILRTGHFQDAGICLDSGHAHIVAAARARSRSSDHAQDGSVTVTREAVRAEYLAMLELMASRILTTHLHDNDSTRDAHLWPADESLKISQTEIAGIPWNETMTILRAAPKQPVCNLEIHYTLGNEPAEIERRAKATFALLNSPLK
jgi:sugar phosphate isomerase/epimerase